MSNSTPIKNLFRAESRPVSHLAAAVFLGTSIYVAHEGLQRLMPGALGNALTALFIALAVLQWLALGRREACLDERDHDRADAVIQQAWMFGAIETALYSAGGLSLSGYAVGGLSITIAVIASAIFAFANFRVKWVSCDAVRSKKAAPIDPSRKPIPVKEFELPAIDFDASNLISFDLEKNIREKTARMEATEAAALAASPPTRDADERLRLATKRIRQRVRRAA